jgi:hypothetical protein
LWKKSPILGRKAGRSGAMTDLKGDRNTLIKLPKKVYGKATKTIDSCERYAYLKNLAII